jgi:predicted nucleic acid-binding protein
LIEKSERLRVFIDADVLFAGSASTTGASHVVLLMAELGLVEGLISAQVMNEVERNLTDKLPAALPAFRAIAGACCRVVSNPAPGDSEAMSRAGMADPKDAPILAAALAHDCRWLVTFNVRDFRPDSRIRVGAPAQLLSALRERLAGMP